MVPICSAVSTFVIQASNTGTEVDGNYITMADDGGDEQGHEDYDMDPSTTDISSAALFVVDSNDGTLYISVNGTVLVATIFQSPTLGPYAQTPQFLEPNDPTSETPYLQCSIAADSLELTCAANDQNLFYLGHYDTSYYMMLGNPGDTDSSYIVGRATLTAVPYG